MGIFDLLFGKKQDTNTTQSNSLHNTQNTNNTTNNNYSNVNSLDLSKQSMLNLSKEESLMQLNLKKDLIQSLCLEKKELNNLTARVAIVMDFSGSMESLYHNGTVQAILDRLLPIAMQFDDNGEMEVWLFDNSFRRMPDISLDNYYNYLNNEKVLNKYSMGGTRYAPVINDVVKKYTYEDISNLPTLVLFITDGDNFVDDRWQSTKAITNASQHPIFWQFVGIGDSNFSYLEELDEMEGRYIDNANFFAVNDLMHISDNELYNRLLSEYPDWISKAKQLGMI